MIELKRQLKQIEATHHTVSKHLNDILEKENLDQSLNKEIYFDELVAIAPECKLIAEEDAPNKPTKGNNTGTQAQMTQ